ncbi:ATP-binding cassette domain-containing protein [Paenibacillus dakarensis]|uniref:ATP-binding cassette domain-containing protein n=1 Tax=Paenibacillus dakarensis TaxID=1527293 RepID=UPI0006D53858|nr:ATP-binding cassette domain-containing protein [Paenibacillus dakarensis]
MLTFEHVHFYYKKGQPIIEDMSFTIGDGEFVSIVGANGCGKSTVAKLIDGLLTPTTGRIKLEQLDTSRPEDLHRIHEQIGYVFQNPEDQFITTTVMDEIIFGMENIRVPKEEMQDRVIHALSAVQMLDYAGAMPHQLSGGQKQRIAIAAIIAMRPQIIIFDEATSMLDPHGREQVLSIMRDLHRKGKTIIHITHHMEEALCADRILLIHQGKLVYDGDPLRFFETVPVSDYQLEPPFTVRVHRMLRSSVPLSADWKEMIRSQWSISSMM